jgi:luciferase family oxidoreductase group 1
MSKPIPFSVLDLAMVKDGETVADAFAETVAVAQHAERLGYKRFWMAEHHNMKGVASAATSVLIGHVAGKTSTIRVGSGGVMLPNHSALVIAEQFGTLATLYPGRIDLGLGRAPGTDGPTMRALRRRSESADDFPEQVTELLALLEPARPGQLLRAVPGEGTRVPVWILGSSLFGAQFAAHMGLPFAFAAHFAPQLLDQAISLYRAGFRPSQWLEDSYAMACIPVIAADSSAEANHLATSAWLRYRSITRGDKDSLFPKPVDDLSKHLTPDEIAMTAPMLRELITGDPDTVAAGIDRFVERTGVDELMVTSVVHSREARLRSYELIAQASAAAPNIALAVK